MIAFGKLLAMRQELGYNPPNLVRVPTVSLDIHWYKVEIDQPPKWNSPVDPAYKLPTNVFATITPADPTMEQCVDVIKHLINLYGEDKVVISLDKVLEEKK